MIQGNSRVHYGFIFNIRLYLPFGSNVLFFSRFCSRFFLHKIYHRKDPRHRCYIEIYWERNGLHRVWDYSLCPRFKPCSTPPPTKNRVANSILKRPSPIHQCGISGNVVAAASPGRALQHRTQGCWGEWVWVAVCLVPHHHAA